ncbi:MAG: S1 RNA-binding domain-containing protein [Deltaproteobacteria bacterium]|nr:S1 RNA-binding domain-containing protein [Deltaproteobacteria bacterium]
MGGLPGAALRRIAEAIDAGREILEVARQESVRPDGLPPSVLSRCWELEDRRLRWVDAARSVAEVRSSDGLPPLPEALLREMRNPDALAALDRASRLAPGATAIELREYVSIWDDSLALARRDGTVRLAASTEDAEKLAPYEDLSGRSDAPAALPAHRWLAARRGEKDGAIGIRFEFPRDAMVDRVRAVRLKLAREESERAPEALLDALVTCELTAALRRQLDERAESEALSAAASAYAALFRIPPVTAEKLGAVFFGRGPRPVSWVVADGAGACLEAGTDAGVAQGWAATLVEKLHGAGITLLVLPASSPAVERLREVERAAEGKFTLSRIPTAAMREAKSGLAGADAELPSGQAAALVLVRRALDPAGSFSSVDPASLGLAEYQHDLDAARVSKYLLTARGLASLEAERAAAVRTAAGTAAAEATAAAAAAPAGMTGLTFGGMPAGTVNSIDDLRPGMILAGTVTTVAEFGAFVNVGLRQEGLVHVSEMADHRVQSASDIVRPGQSVRVRVVDVDRNRNRISLSLRLQDTRPPRGPGGPGGGRAKSAALRELDKYFKK